LPAIVDLLPDGLPAIVDLLPGGKPVILDLSFRSETPGVVDLRMPWIGLDIIGVVPAPNSRLLIGMNR
jgi:hypothetical protein